MLKEKNLLLTKVIIVAAVIAVTCFGAVIPMPELRVVRAQARPKSHVARSLSGKYITCLSLCILCVLCVSVVSVSLGKFTTETQRTQSSHRGFRLFRQAPRHYACPMHPEVRSIKRGKCPKCGMALRLVDTTTDKGAATVTNGPTNMPGTETDNTSSFSSSRIPDIVVIDQNGKRLNFYSDLIKGKTVAINFIFTTCTTICPPLTATFRKVQQDLATSAPEAKLISISVDPSTDTPQRLNDFAARFKAGPGWSFVTGDSTDIASLLRALGAAVADKNDHTPMILIGNDVAGYWTRAYGLSSPTALVKTIAEAANHK